MANLTPTQFQASLIPASFRGIFFHVTDDTTKTGLRVALHQYPNRPAPFAESLNKQARQFAMSAFLVGDGGNLQGQLYALLSACETDGPGTLVHPLLGAQQVVCTGCEVQQTVAGRTVEVKLTFVEAGSILTPTTTADTQAATTQAATTSTTAVANNLPAGKVDVEVGDITTPDGTVDAPPTDGAAPSAPSTSQAGPGNSSNSGDALTPTTSVSPAADDFNSQADADIAAGQSGF